MTDYRARDEAYARKVAREKGIDPDILVALISRESSWNPNVPGDGGQAVGYGQLHRGAVADVGGSYEKAANSPQDNITYTAAYLRLMYNRFGNYYDALRGYNAGPGAASKDPNAASEYAKDVLKRAGASTQDEGITDPNEVPPVKDSPSDKGGISDSITGWFNDQSKHFSEMLWEVIAVLVIITIGFFGLYAMITGQTAGSAIRGAISGAASIAIKKGIK